MSAEWLQSIADMLDNDQALGKNAQRQAAYDAAAEMDGLLPYDTLASRLLRSMFVKWISSLQYMRMVEPLDHALPDTMTRSDLEIATEYGLTTAKSIQTKQEWLETARSRRVERCTAHLQTGWCFEDCISFVCAKDEWGQARRKARVAA